MRIIALPTDQKEAQSVFGIINTATFQGKGVSDDAGKARAFGKLQDVIEALGHDGEPVTDQQGNVVVPRVLNDGVTEIRLEDAHWEILKGRFFSAGVDWLPGANRRVVAVHTLVCEAVEEKPGAKKDENAEPKPTKKKRG